MNNFANWLTVNEVMKTEGSHREICRPKVRLNLDSDVIEYFKSIDNYEELINDIFRKHIDNEKQRQQIQKS